MPRVSAVLERICGDRTGQFQAPSFRIDHINVHTHPPGVFGYGLHGGNGLLDGTPMPSQYYKKDGETLPTRKGVSLNPTQFAALMSASSDIEAALENL